MLVLEGPVISAGLNDCLRYDAGAVEYLQQRYALSKWQMRGASAGALVATLAACNVNIDTAFECAHRLSVENKLFERPLGLAGRLSSPAMLVAGSNRCKGDLESLQA